MSSKSEKRIFSFASDVSLTHFPRPVVILYFSEFIFRVDWVTMDEEEEDGEDYNSMGLSGSSEAPF